jgi:hypothetical protein
VINSSLSLNECVNDEGMLVGNKEGRKKKGIKDRRK